MDDEIARFDRFVIQSGSLALTVFPQIAGIARLDFWFKPDVIQRLARVKGVVLPTDVAIRSFFQMNGFEHVDTFHRFIKNKQMPLRNSPTNISGAADDAMVREHIVVMRRRDLPTA